MGSKSGDKIKIGYDYIMDIHYIFCQNAVTTLRKIKLAKQLIWEGTVTTNSTISISKPTAFGGPPPDGSGGFSSSVDVFFGSDTQAVSSYIKNSMHSGSEHTPAYRGRFGMLFRNTNWGSSGSATPVSILASGDAGIDWYNSKKWVTVPGAEFPELNPIHMIYYWLTNNRNGQAISPSELDASETSGTFKDAADLCYSEGLGLSFLFGGANKIEDNLREILNHIDGSVFQDPSDGLFKVKLARDDYDVGTLLTLDDSNSNTLDIHDTGFDELVNHLTIEYYDTATNLTNSVDITDLGLREAMGGYTVSKKIKYNGCNSRDLALTLGTRDMLGLSRPLKRVKIEANREAGSLKPNDVIKWTNTDEGVTDLVLRVRSVKKGGLKNRRIELDCIQDVFAYGTEVFSSTNPVDWEDPAEIAPEDISELALIEAPYWYYWFKFAGIPADSEAGDGMALILAKKETTADEYFFINEKLSSESVYELFYENGDFCPYGYLDSSGITYDMISSGTVTVVLQEFRDLVAVRTGTAAYINGEIYRVDAVDEDTGEVTLGVGCADTVTKEHAANSLVLFFGYQGGYASDDYIDGQTVNIKLQPKTPYETLDIGDATAHSITMDERADKPYPPAKFRLNGDFYPIAIMGILSVSWAQRNRVTQEAELYNESNGDIAHETGTNYEVRGYDENGSLKWQPDTPGTSIDWDYEDVDSALSDGLYNNHIRIRLWSTRDGLISFQEHDYTFDRADYGYNYGKYYGGYES